MFDLIFIFKFELLCKALNLSLKYVERHQKEELYMFEGGAKLVHHGNDKWLIKGYHYDGEDVGKAVSELARKVLHIPAY